MQDSAICYICPSDKFVDDHHIDCCEGELSPETVPLCRRCHRTYHDLGVEWFDDEYLDKAIEIENKRREIVRFDYRGIKLEPLKREDIERSDYWNKIHGVKLLKSGKKNSRAEKNVDSRQGRLELISAGEGG